MIESHPATLLFSSLLAGPLWGEEPGVHIPESIELFFENHCYDCHDEATAKADLNLEDLTRSITNNTDAQHWQDIFDQLNAGEMPPKNLGTLRRIALNALKSAPDDSQRQRKRASILTRKQLRSIHDEDQLEEILVLV